MIQIIVSSILENLWAKTRARIILSLSKMKAPYLLKSLETSTKQKKMFLLLEILMTFSILMKAKNKHLKNHHYQIWFLPNKLNHKWVIIRVQYPNQKKNLLNLSNFSTKVSKRQLRKLHLMNLVNQLRRG